MSHMMKVWERIIESRLRNRVKIIKQQERFMPSKRTTNAMFSYNVDGKVQKRSKRATLCIRGPRKSLRQGSVKKAVVLHEKIRTSGKVYANSTGYVQGSKTVLSCAVGTTESFKVKVGLYQESALSSFLFAVIMDRLTDEVKSEPSWTMLFAHDIVI